MSLFQSGGQINFYGIFTAIGLLFSLLVIFLLARKDDHLQKDELVFCGLWTALGAFIGAHILFFIVSLPDFVGSLVLHPPVDVGDFLLKLYYASSGLVYYGGLLGAILAIAIFVRKRHLPMRPYLNIFALIFPLFHAFGRIGCVFSGCCYGIEYHGFAAIHYPDSVIVSGINDHITDFTRFPVQPMEALIEIIIFIILFVLYIKKHDSVSILTPYLLVYAVIRFLDEFLRGDLNRGIWGPFSTSQWIAIIVFVVTVVYLLVKRKQPISNSMH